MENKTYPQTKRTADCSAALGYLIRCNFVPTIQIAVFGYLDCELSDSSDVFEGNYAIGFSGRSLIGYSRKLNCGSDHGLVSGLHF